ncbi:Phosphopantothenoylcysteine decarboxylase [Aquisphaera giovannonii]|uniref:Phosphopantothenoylcysteine decarboxylase n=1 Tax=Aquisphaera giovannonii TaxID=406548 RepID=A0A5B9W074_9BACT|nr:flavoprotein [Aquisphaera giovannonii]QEH34022.1 Phosphopantothenoylcysteine decarboxylase [Aquisphaera giovannonii]
MARVLLGVTGSVAAILTPALDAALRRAGPHAGGNSVRVLATEPSLYFFDAAGLDPGEGPDEAPGRLYRDRDEWPGVRYRRDDPVLHIELRKWADVLVVAPLDANTLGKFALGLSDNLLTCVFRAWDFSRPVILAPAMNTMMWRSPVTARHLGQILLDRAGLAALPDGWSLDSAPEHFARLAPRIILIPPRSKRLACGDVGVGAMAEVRDIAEAVFSWSQDAPRPEREEEAGAMLF